MDTTINSERRLLYFPTETLRMRCKADKYFLPGFLLQRLAFKSCIVSMLIFTVNPQTNCMQSSHFHWTSPGGLRILKADCFGSFVFLIKTKVEALALDAKEDFRDGGAKDKKHL